MNKITPTSIRIPTYLREWLKDRAINNSRSVNGELIQLMKKIKEKEDVQKKT